MRYKKAQDTSEIKWQTPAYQDSNSETTNTPVQDSAVLRRVRHLKELGDPNNNIADSTNIRNFSLQFLLMTVNSNLSGMAEEVSKMKEDAMNEWFQIEKILQTVDHNASRTMGNFELYFMDNGGPISTLRENLFHLENIKYDIEYIVSRFNKLYVYDGQSRPTYVSEDQKNEITNYLNVLLNSYDKKRKTFSNLNEEFFNVDQTVEYLRKKIFVKNIDESSIENLVTHIKSFFSYNEKIKMYFDMLYKRLYNIYSVSFNLGTSPNNKMPLDRFKYMASSDTSINKNSSLMFVKFLKYTKASNI